MADSIFHQVRKQTLYHLLSFKGCYSSVAGVLQCHCEKEFFWSCDQCEAYGTCNSNRVGEPCQCINQLPPDGQLCRASKVHFCVIQIIFLLISLLHI